MTIRASERSGTRLAGEARYERSRRSPGDAKRELPGAFLRLVAGWTTAGLLVCLLTLTGCLHTDKARLQSEEETDRERYADIKTIGDVTTVGKVLPVPVGGVGLVEGLEGTGGDSPPSSYRRMLLEQLRKDGVEKPRSLLNAPDTALVLVHAVIPPGSRKGDRVDIEVKLPPGSQATSLRSGYLRRCRLYTYGTTTTLSRGYKGPPASLRGKSLVTAEGRVLVSLRDGDEEARQKRGRIWGGGRFQSDQPFALLLNPGQQYARVASLVANRINETFHGSFRAAPDVQVAKARNNLAIDLYIPAAYRLNLPRFLRVVRFIPLKRRRFEYRPKDGQPSYRERLTTDLLDPARTVIAARRLESIGDKAKPILKRGMKHSHYLVRFSSAEALAYLGSPMCGDELAKAAEHVQLRAHALAALASLDEAVAQDKLIELMTRTSNDQLRYGAFRALQALNQHHPVVRGAELKGSFWVHHVAPQTQPMVHISTLRRPEIVLFGSGHQFRPPFAFSAGEFSMTAGEGDKRCIVSRFRRGGYPPLRKTCSLEVFEVLDTLSELGGTYPEATALLQQARQCKCLNARVQINAVPQGGTVYELVRLGQNDGLVPGEDPSMLENHDLGDTPTLYQLTPGAKSGIRQVSAVEGE